MMQNQDFCNGTLRPTLDPDFVQCECGQVVPTKRMNHRPQKNEKQPSHPSQVSLQVPLFSL